jgi:hypothetical protein
MAEIERLIHCDICRGLFCRPCSITTTTARATARNFTSEPTDNETDTTEGGHTETPRARRISEENRGQRYGSFKWSHETLLRVLRELKQRHGREASYTDIRNRLIPAASTWSKFFGGLKKARETAEADMNVFAEAAA